MTTITDNFNRGDNASSLGTTSGGGATWTTGTGTMGISSLKAYASALGGGRAFASIPGGSADGTVTVTVSSGGGIDGVCFRVQDASNFWYASGNYLIRVISGSGTVVLNPNAGSDGVVSVELSGTSITVKLNGATIASTTSALLQTATDHGIYTESTTARLDDFSYSDTITPASSPRRSQLVRGQGVVRAAVR